ncbi:MAG: putative GTP cyclohydrolase 1 [Prokaryotic dsDNA virus sp.]|nr:MAG: putative GTP cyclohydrolase 1 [Prokaryotic dsDNA virus sp.]|tara:strand:+ start:495 stop:1325 length:831 start_codon:yes stop_codon:yes gene_type:complete
MEQNNRSIITWEEIYKRIKTLPKGKCYGVPRGGQVVAGLTGNAVDTPDEADYILDDLIDSGRTAMKWKEKYPDKPFLALWNKIEEKNLGWLEFPWEENGERDAEDSVARLLQAFGEDTNREGLKDTPKRYVKFFKEFLSPPEWNCTTFESEGYDEMIVQTNIPFHSLCEHHIAPFFGVGHIAYIPGERIVGLSKLARTLETFSRRLQNQERITNQVAEFLQEQLQPKGVAVVLTAKHMCMEMRGVKKHNTHTTTSKMIGVFKDDLNCRNEFLNLIK